MELRLLQNRMEMEKIAFDIIKSTSLKYSTFELADYMTFRKGNAYRYGVVCECELSQTELYQRIVLFLKEKMVPVEQSINFFLALEIASDLNISQTPLLNIYRDFVRLSNGYNPFKTILPSDNQDSGKVKVYLFLWYKKNEQECNEDDVVESSLAEYMDPRLDIPSDLPII